MLDSITLPLEFSSSMPPGLKRTSLPRISLPFEPLRLMPASEPRWETLAMMRFPSESSMVTPASPARDMVLPSTRLRCEPALMTSAGVTGVDESVAE